MMGFFVLGVGVGGKGRDLDVGMGWGCGGEENALVSKMFIQFFKRERI